MKWTRLAMLLVAATLPLASFAQSPEAEKSQDRLSEGASAAPASRPDRRDRELRQGRGLLGLGGRPRRNFSEEEWKAAETFYRKHSDKWMDVFEKMDGDRHDYWRARIVQRYETIQALEENNPELYAIKVNQLEIEDRIFDAKQRLGDAPAKSADAEKIKRELRQIVAELVKSRVEERKARISRIEKLLAQERKKLAEDERRQDQMVNRQFDALLKSDDAVLSPRELREEQRRRDREGDKDGEVQ